MYSNSYNIVRRVMSSVLVGLTRLKTVDILLFTVVLMAKLYIFSGFIGMSKMRMNGEDAFIELGAVLLTIFWTIWLPPRGRIIALIIINLILSFVMYADIIYYRYFQDLITVPVLMQMGQVDSLGESINTLLAWKDIIFFIDWIVIVPFLVYVIWRGRGDLRRANEQAGRTSAPLWRKAVARIIISVAVFLLGSNLVFTNVEEAKRTWAQGIFVGAWWNLSIYNVTGEIGFHGFDIYRYAKQNWFDSSNVTAEQASESKTWIDERGETRKQLEKDALFGAYKGSNVLMIQLEAFQNFMIGQSIGGEEITPNMNKLIKESAYFSDFYHQTAQGRTSDADFAANCSMQPVGNGSVFIQYANHDFDCMPQTLKQEGYVANVFHAYEGGFWNRNTMYHNLQYDKFYSRKHFTLDERVGWSLGDKSFFQQSLDVISDQKQPFYSFLITLSSHHPYTMPDDQKKLNVGELDGTIMGDYLQATHYVDAAIGELVDRMKEEGLWDNTILLMYGDHDNSIKDMKLFETFLGKTLSEVEQTMIMKQVPLIVHLPRGEHAGEYANVGGQIDVTPTVMHLLGISTADKYMIGMPLITDQPVTGHKVVLRNGYWTDRKVFFMPSADGIAENGKCWNISENAISDINGCLPGVEEASTELAMSDQIIANDLIADYKKQNATVAQTGSKDDSSVQASAGTQ